MRRFGLCRFVAPSKLSAGSVAACAEKRVTVYASAPRFVICAMTGSDGAGEETRPTVAYASWRAPQPLRPPEVTPLRPRAFEGPGGVRYAAGPFGRAGLVMLVARGGDQATPQAPAFHVTEVDRLAQLVRASTLVLGSRLDEVAAVHAGPDGAGSSRVAGWPVNPGMRLAAALDS